jgi:hypothetical protein
MKKPLLWSVLKEVHEDELGTVSLETVLIVGAIALPVLFVLIKYGWPKIRDYFKTGVQDLQNESDTAKQTY